MLTLTDALNADMLNEKQGGGKLGKVGLVMLIRWERVYGQVRLLALYDFNHGYDC